MCQQTRVAVAEGYFARWLERFPTLHDLAVADEQCVLAAWQGLGYYRRARMLHAGAKALDGRALPRSAAEWREIPGIGPYTAAAIASICLGEPAAVVDGNVERVYARLHADAGDRKSLKARATRWANEVLDPAHPGDWNQAVMELGALICTPRNPDCAACPLRAGCAGKDSPHAYPAPAPRREAVNLAFDVYVPMCAGEFGLRQIPPGEWAEGQWEFWRTNGPAPAWAVRPVALPEFRHTVTHHRILLRPYLCAVPERIDGLRWLSPAAIHAIPLPASQKRILKSAVAAL